MTTQHPALRLADMTDITDRSVIWQKWKQDACEQLHTQHALLERARLALNSIYDRRTDSTMEFSRSVVADITTHLEPK